MHTCKLLENVFMHINIKKNHHHEKIAFVLAAAVAVDITTFVSGNSLRDPKTVVQKENGRGLTTGELDWR